MKPILGLASLLGHALVAATGIQQSYSAPFGGGKRRYYPVTRPTAARWWHDLEQPGQCARLRAAKDKRERRAVKAREFAQSSFFNNFAHRNSPHAPSLDTTYVAK